MTHARIAFPAVVVVLACTAEMEIPIAAPPGEPLPGLNADQLARFEAGRALFNRQFTPAEGLGPLFNEERCSSCHDLPTVGGTGVQLVDKATHFDPSGGCDLLRDEGADNIQQRATPLLRAHGITRKPRPASATAFGQISPPALFGSGLIEAITLETLRSLADPDDRDGDGISGRIGFSVDGRPARFGRKAEFATLADFVAGALILEMGLTSAAHPAEQTLAGEPIPGDVDPAADPELTPDDVDRLTDYVRFLAPVAREPATDPSLRDSLARGEAVFVDLGCAACHHPRFTTTSEIAALGGKTVQLYSDLLLHDIGTGLADICGVAASPSEWRTAKLMGLRFRPTFLHDGRANTLRAAIEEHGGEAAAARAAFTRSGQGAQAFLLRFLASL